MFVRLVMAMTVGLLGGSLVFAVIMLVATTGTADGLVGLDTVLKGLFAAIPAGSVVTLVLTIVVYRTSLAIEARDAARRAAGKPGLPALPPTGE